MCWEGRVYFDHASIGYSCSSLKTNQKQINKKNTISCIWMKCVLYRSVWQTADLLTEESNVSELFRVAGSQHAAALHWPLVAVCVAASLWNPAEQYRGCSECVNICQRLRLQRKLVVGHDCNARSVCVSDYKHLSVTGNVWSGLKIKLWETSVFSYPLSTAHFQG